MGVGSENKDKDMLRPISEGIRNKPLFAANNTQREIGFDDGDEEYPPEPSPSPVPEPPPVEDGHPDMEKYEEEVGNYLDAHDAWKEEVARMDSAKAADDYSNELNGVIKKCCNEFLPTELYLVPVGGDIVKAINADKWGNGVFNNWNYVGNEWWNDSKQNNNSSYIPDDLQEKVKDKDNDYFIVNGHKMNRHEYGNYVKGATAQYAFPGIFTSTGVNALGTGWSIYKSLFKGENFDIGNETDDAKYVYLGAFDMAMGIIKLR